MSQVLDAPESLSNGGMSFAISTSASPPISLEKWPTKARILGMLIRAAISKYAGSRRRYEFPSPHRWQRAEMFMDYLSRTDPYFCLKVMSG
jgi:hypothetical protein